MFFLLYLKEIYFLSLSHSKLVQALAVIQIEEWALLTTEALSHTSDVADVFAIYSFLKSEKDNLGTLPEVEEVVYQHFPHLSVKVFQNYLSVIFGWVESWLAHREMTAKKYEEELFLLEAYNRRGAYKLADQTYKNLEKKISSATGLDLEREQALARALRAQYFSNNPIKNEQGGALYEKFVMSWLRTTKEHASVWLTELYNFGAITEYDYSQMIAGIHQILAFLPESPLSAKLDNLVCLWEKNDVQVFESLTASLKENQFEEGSFIHTVLTLYLIVKGNTLHAMGQLPNVKAIAQLYELAMESGVLMDKGKISMVRFTNMLSALSATQSYEWVEKFINRWINNVITSDLKGSQNLAHALNCFYHEKYMEVIRLTALTSYGSQEQKMRALALHVMALYVLRYDDYETFKTQLKNFALAVQRQKNSLNKKQYQGYFNLVDFLKKLDKASRKQITINLDAYNYLVYRTWCEKMLATKKGLTPL